MNLLFLKDYAIEVLFLLLRPLSARFSSIHTQLSRPNTARGSFTGPVTVGPTEV